MGREIVILWAGRHQRDRWDQASAPYRVRIGRELPIREVPIRVRTAAHGAPRLRAEGEALLAALPDPCWSVALHRKGKMRDSASLAGWLANILDSWPHPVAFLLGSDLGLDADLLGKCRDRLSLGPLTLPHELARLVLYEQLYRALSIRAGIKYHREPL